MKSFRNKVAAITGAGSGIGRALAIELASRGCDLALSDVEAGGLGETAALAETMGVRVSTAQVDVATRDQVRAWAAHTADEHGKVNLIFNNAGVAHAGTVEATDYADYEWIMGINFWGVVHGTKEFLPYLMESGEGHVINVSSVFGLFAQPMASAYNASKFAVRGFTEALRQELDMFDRGVSASCVHPGGVRTNIAKRARVGESVGALSGKTPTSGTTSFERLLRTTADQAARTILAGVSCNERRILIGVDAHAADWMQRTAPAHYQSLVTSAMRWIRAH